MQHRRHGARRRPELAAHDAHCEAIGRDTGGTAAVVTRKLAALDAHCAAIGRDPATVTRTAMVSLFVCANESDRDGLRQLVGYDNSEVSDRMIIAMGDEATEQLGALVTSGVDEIIVNLPLVKDVDAFHTAASVLRDATG